MQLLLLVIAVAIVVLGIALVIAVALYFLMDRTRLGAMIRAGVDDMEMARGVGIPVSLLFTVVFCLGAVLARTEGRVAIGTLARRFPGLTLATERAARNGRMILRGLDELPVTF